MRALAAAAALFWASSAGAAPEAAAPQDGGSLQGVLEQVRRDAASMRDLEPAQLVRYHFDLGAAPAAPERAPSKTSLGGRAGYTHATVTRTAGAAWEQRPVGRGLYAVYVRSIDVDFGLAQRVLVALELPEGGCAYSATWRHELRHAADFGALFTQELPEFRRSFDRAVGELRLPTEAAPAVLDEPAAERLRAAAAERLESVLEARARALTARFESARSERDAQAESKAVAASCPSSQWLSASAGLPQGGPQPGLLVP